NAAAVGAGVGGGVQFGRGELLRRNAPATQREEGIRERLAGFVMKERAFPRHGYEVRVYGEPAGEVTSGILSPSLDQGIGLAYVPVESAKPGTAIEVVVRNRPVAAEIVRPPFYKQGSIRR